MDVDEPLTTKEKAKRKKDEINAWLAGKFGNNEVVQKIKALDGSKQGPMKLMELREWVAVVAEMVSIGLTDESAGRYGGSQTVTKAAVAGYLGRGGQWVALCKEASELLKQKRDKRNVMEWLDKSDEIEMGVRSFRDKLRDFK